MDRLRVWQADALPDCSWLIIGLSMSPLSPTSLSSSLLPPTHLPTHNSLPLSLPTQHRHHNPCFRNLLFSASCSFFLVLILFVTGPSIIFSFQNARMWFLKDPGPEPHGHYQTSWQRLCKCSKETILEGHTVFRNLIVKIMPEDPYVSWL